MIRLSKRVTQRIEALGFASPGIVALSDYGDNPGKGLTEFLAQNYHGTMEWLADTQERRAHPQNMWADAKAAIVLGMNYGPASDPMVTLDQSSKATISVYARNKDYHDLIKGRLKEIAALVANDTDADVKVFVDTAPLMEKPLAERAGIGWQGKHTNLVSRDFGSWLFLGVILSASELEPTPSEDDHCGSCTACLDICPTNAFPAPYKLDARKCISYLTIEHKGPVAIDLREQMGNRIYGCDDCLSVCPWNKYAQESKEIKLQARKDLNAPSLAELSQLSDTAFREMFAGSPIKRIGQKQFIRNVLYAIGNSDDKTLLPYAEMHIGSDDDVVADAAMWAANKLGGESEV